MRRRTRVSGHKILVVEDDLLILDGMVRNLKYEGYRVETATVGEEALEKAFSIRPDLVVLDLMLPDMDGFDVCRLLKKHSPELPILILTARSSVEDRVHGLKIGADDYLIKPFALAELLARVQALLRRKELYERPANRFSFADVVVDFDALTLKKGKKTHKLSSREAGLLRFLVKNAGRALDRNAILNNVWGYDYEGTARTIDNFITRLRAKIEDDPENPRHIRTVFGVGYMFASPEEGRRSGKRR